MGYEHTQKGYLHWLLGGIALLLLALVPAAYADEPEAGFILLGVGMLLAALTPCFATLTVRDDGDALRIEFGPWRLFRKRLRYVDVRTAAPGRSAVIDGWGVHWIIGRGWTWNIHGFEAVELTLQGGGRLRIGTDDSARLAAFFATRITPLDDSKSLR